MMRKTLFAALAVVAFACPVAAQQEVDPTIETYKILLTEANDRLAAQVAKVAAAERKAKALQVELDKLKGEKPAGQ